jgi:DNA-binding MarR family transcriptional regulator
MNETVNSLADRGFAIRTPDPNDARKILISATKEGEDMQNSASKEFHAFMNSHFAPICKTRREGPLTGFEEMVKLSHTDLDKPTDRAGVAPQGKRNSRQSPQQ